MLFSIWYKSASKVVLMISHISHIILEQKYFQVIPLKDHKHFELLSSEQKFFHQNSSPQGSL